jgi:hypothetical protein
LNYRVSLQIFYFFGVVALLSTTTCGGRHGPGSVASAMEPPAPQKAASAPLRRLTAEQYRRSVRDLLGLSAPFLDGLRLPLDEGTAGFFANTLAPVSELQLDQYGRAAEAIAKEASAQLPALVGREGGCGADLEGGCVDRFIERFGRRVYRRPLGSDERQALRALYDGERGAAGSTAGYKLVVQALLSSPHFLYLVENPSGKAGVQPVAPFALAARLAYYLWGSTPDAALLEAAEKGQLGTVAGLRTETARLMRDERFADSLASFHMQWLDLTELPAVEKRNKIYPLFTPELRAAMQGETTRFADRVIRQEDGTLETLLNGRFSVLGGGLFELYGLPVPPDKGATWQRVNLSASSRAGLLTQPSFLTMHAHWDKPSLVLRGKTIRERLLCTDLPPPPPDVNNTPPPLDPKVSMRERFEDHRSEVSCARCHRLIDPLGIPFESYDAIGALRTMDGPVPVDPSSELGGTAHSDGPVKNAEELAARLAGSDEVRDCLVTQWFRYALGRDVGPADATSLAQLRQTFRQAGSRIPVLIAAIPATDSFRYVEVTP